MVRLSRKWDKWEELEVNFEEYNVYQWRIILNSLVFRNINGYCVLCKILEVKDEKQFLEEFKIHYGGYWTGMSVGCDEELWFPTEQAARQAYEEKIEPLILAKKLYFGG